MFSLAEVPLDIRRPFRRLCGDKAKCAFQRYPGNSLVSVVAVDEDAGGPPVGRSHIHLAVPAHSARKLGRRSELTPPDDVRSVVDEGGVRPVCSNESLFVFLVLSRPLFRQTGCEVKEGAPAAAPYSIVFSDHSLKVGPGRGPELPD